MFRRTYVHIILALLHVLSVSASGRFYLPSWLGPFSLSISTHELHTSRDDPYAPTPQKRRLMLSIYRPLSSRSKCQKASPLNYMPSQLANYYNNDLSDFFFNNGSHGTLEQLQLHNCRDVIPLSIDKAPLLLFSTGLGFSRLLYSAIVSAVASSGYTVVSIDHTYDADAVEFPGGELVIGNQDNLNVSHPHQAIRQIKDLVKTREADVKSVLDALEHGKVEGIDAGGSGVRAGIFGHSLGGLTAAASLVNETRLEGGLNYDGSIFGPVVKQGFKKPFLLFGQAFHSIRKNEDHTWNELWKVLRGWKLELAVAGTVHDCFSDLPLIEQITGLRKEIGEKKYQSVLSTVEGKRMLQIVWKYTVAYFDYVMKDKHSNILSVPSKAYPEITIVRKSK